MPCEDCPLRGEKVKCDQTITLKIDDRTADYIGSVLSAIECNKSEFIRCCIDLAGPQILRHPDLIKLLPLQSSK